MAPIILEIQPAFVTDTDEHGELKGHLEYFGHGKCIVKGFKKAPYIKMCDPIKSTPKRERTPYHIKDGKHYIRKVYEGPPGASKDFFGIIYVEMEKGRYYDEIMENLNETCIDDSIVTIKKVDRNQVPVLCEWDGSPV